MDNRRRVLGPLTIELKPVGPKSCGGYDPYELRVSVTVNGQRAHTSQYVMGVDEMRSRFDQLFDMAKGMLEREINGD